MISLVKDIRRALFSSAMERRLSESYVIALNMLKSMLGGKKGEKISSAECWTFWAVSGNIGSLKKSFSPTFFF